MIYKPTKEMKVDEDELERITTTYQTGRDSR